VRGRRLLVLLSPEHRLTLTDQGITNCCALLLGARTEGSTLGRLFCNRRHSGRLQQTKETEVVEVLHKRCCGMDVHKRTVAACLKTSRETEIRTYETTTDELRAMALWLNEAGCTHVAMESTGVYLKPVYNILEFSGMDIEVVNARHVKGVPGRKTDVKDAEWRRSLDQLSRALLLSKLQPVLRRNGWVMGAG
jgi:Transposase